MVEFIIYNPLIIELTKFSILNTIYYSIFSI